MSSPVSEHAASVLRHLAPHLLEARAYEPGRSTAPKQIEPTEPVLKLSSNENPWGPSPRAMVAVRQTAEQMHRYPDASSTDLRAALASHTGVPSENIVTECGSEGLLATIFRTVVRDDDEVVSCQGTFVGLRVLCQTRGVTLHELPLRDYSFDIPSMRSKVSSDTGLVYVANPNNPTGTVVDSAEILELASTIPDSTLLVLDEAYAEYTTSETLPGDLREFANVVRLRTFSKAYGLAGLRVGYGICHRSVAQILMKAKLPFVPNILAQRAGVEALADQEYLDHVLTTTKRQRTRLISELSEIGYSVLPSEANFVTLEFPDETTADSFAQSLAERGILVRPLGAFGLGHCVRITVGRPLDNDRLLDAARSASPVA